LIAIAALVALAPAWPWPSPPAAAQGLEQTDQPPSAERPSRAWLVAGIATAVGGGVLQYRASRHYADGLEAGTGWIYLGSLGVVVTATIIGQPAKA